jgi:cytidylate kinase
VIGRVVAIGGPPGGGKSTAGRQVVTALGLDYRSAGDVFRSEAAARGMDVEAFGGYAESHPEVDRQLDDSMQALARPGVLLDGRIQGTLCRRRGVPVYAVIVTAAEGERARRVALRDGQSVEEARRRIRERAEGERRRYRALYGIDVDTEVGDLTIDSTSLPADRVAAEIVQFLERGATEGSR